MSKYLLNNKSNDPIKSFKLLPFINEEDYPCKLRSKSRDLGLTREIITSYIKSFIDVISNNKKYGEDHFLWRHDSNKNKMRKTIPLVVKYLFWRGIEELVYVEEIEQILSLECKIKNISFTGKSQWWHNYADAGYDVLTIPQYRNTMIEKGTLRYNDLYKARGLILISTRPGPKYKTRKSDPNDPLRWGEKKKEFDNKCAICGDAEALFSSSNGKAVRLEKGHVDPRQPYSHSNIIPQCGSCNNHSDKHIYGPSIDNPKRWIIKEKLSTTTKQ
jgi:hypothetical protein